ncbi:hypothetical protein G6F35_017497 [Rhizopus arrhizus]|nr:hypothetical protein G6F31_018817 [Rhizopus arrhizus]KAG1168242.1 hypothetical protein G6F35_017497 [Rhizopus arrhizus]KAG1373986.1 hypothetical protein G6F59_018451 [Rhizopus arrhizus]
MIDLDCPAGIVLAPRADASCGGVIGALQIILDRHPEAFGVRGMYNNRHGQVFFRVGGQHGIYPEPSESDKP